MLSQEYYKNYCKTFNSIESFLKDKGKCDSSVIKEICQIRGYYPERMSSILKKAGFFFVGEISDKDKAILKNTGVDYGLFSEDGVFLLENRYVFPVRDLLGSTVALIGWYPDKNYKRKYITTPSKLFSKRCLFYGMEQISETGIGRKYVLVEGIFDSLSVRSLGIPCIALMGITTSRYKVSMYSLFSEIVAIPDNDLEGKNVIAVDSWKLPTGSKYFRWVGDSCKDIDDLCNSYDKEDIYDFISTSFSDKRRVVTKKV